MSNDVEANGYNDSNRAFLQAFLARGSMTLAEAKPILAAIFSAQEERPVQPEDITSDDLVSYVAAANAAISPFDLEIRSTLRQTSSNGNHGDNAINGQEVSDNDEGSARNRPERVYALVNTTSDPLTQLATTYTADEIAFLKRVLDAIFETYNTRRSEAMVITGTQAMQLAKVSSSDDARRESVLLQNGQSQGTPGTAQSLSMTQAEIVMKRLVEEGWFEKSRRGFYNLSPRALMELRGWLVATYNEDSDDGRGRNDKIKFCAACKDIITVGQRCANRDCTGRLHDHCTQNFFRMQRAEKCPVCKAAWPNEKFVGERAITTTDQYRQGKRRSTNVQRTSPTQDAMGEDAGAAVDSG